MIEMEENTGQQQGEEERQMWEAFKKADEELEQLIQDWRESHERNSAV